LVTCSAVIGISSITALEGKRIAWQPRQGCLTEGAEGRLEVTGRDEVGEVAHWFNTFMDKLHDIIAQVKWASQ
jgi:methyl-accepting chemotaxis protein